ncbi:hypothetical protein HPB47_025232, partial [Ixodes persulcatus]
LHQGLVVSVVDLLVDLRSTRRQRKLEKHGMQLAEPKPENEEHFGPDQFQIALRRTSKEKEKNANDVRDDSGVQESEAILPDDGPDVQSDSDTQESKSILPDDGPEPECDEEVREPGSLVAALTKDVRDDFAALQCGTIPANARLGLCSESYTNGSEILRRILSRDKTDRATLDAGLDGSSANTVTTAVTIKT